LRTEAVSATGQYRAPSHATESSLELDITWLPTPVRGLYLHLYLVMDGWSRRTVDWRIARGDSAALARENYHPGLS